MIFHITDRQSWEKARKKGVYEAPSLRTEGFIHLSTSAQVLGVANFLFAGRSDLILLAVDPNKLEAKLIFEGPASNKFPHVYGSLNLSAVVEAFDFSPGPLGFERLPEGVQRLAHTQVAELGRYIGAFEDLQENQEDGSLVDADFGRKLGLSRLGLHQVTLRPGQKTSQPHCESLEEEFVLVLKGKPHVWIDGAIYEAQALDAVAFPSGTGIAHCVINNTMEDVELLVVGERTKLENRCYWPLHPEKQSDPLWWAESPRQALGPNSAFARDLSGLCQRSQRPAFFRSVQDLGFEPGLPYPGDTETFSEGSPLGKSLGLQRLAIWVERVPAGKRTSWPHAHRLEEEAVYVLSGQPSVWLDGFLHRLNPQEAVAFPAGTGIAHTFLNEGVGEAFLVVIGERKVPDDQVFYPLHPKRNLEMKSRNQLWEDRPRRDLGPHLGTALIEAPSMTFH